jgi:hypothetical protein
MLPVKPPASTGRAPGFIALVLAIFSLSLQDDWDIEIALSQPSHGFISKVSKDRESAGGERGAAITASALPWAPSFNPCALAIAQEHNVPALVLFQTVVIRAPPAVSSV